MYCVCAVDCPDGFGDNISWELWQQFKTVTLIVADNNDCGGGKDGGDGDNDHYDQPFVITLW